MKQPLSAVGLLIVLWTAPAWTPQHIDQDPKDRIAWHYDAGNTTEPMSETKTGVGKAVAGFKLKADEGMRLFSIDAAILDLSSGLIRVTVHKGWSGPVLDEFDVKTGGAAIRASTEPPFE